MKQHITKEQWNEITFEQQMCYFEVIGSKNRSVITFLPNIGRMIQFLGKKKGGYIDDSYESTVFGAIGKTYIDGFVDIGWVGKDELCDALWECVKNKLNG